MRNYGIRYRLTECAGQKTNRVNELLNKDEPYHFVCLFHVRFTFNFSRYGRRDAGGP